MSLFSIIAANETHDDVDTGNGDGGDSSQNFRMGVEPTSLRLERRGSRKARACQRGLPAKAWACQRRLATETSFSRRRPHRFRFVVLILVGSSHHVGEGAGEEGSVEERKVRRKGMERREEIGEERRTRKEGEEEEGKDSREKREGEKRGRRGKERGWRGKEREVGEERKER